ncbi:MAG: hypothetical protein FWH20_04310 [Oscillospiraceae bacterium]|nr:hypothetical protein [Oscillospiraceae bacterium]
MKAVCLRAARRLADNKGETIMETLISFTIMGIMLMGAVLIIQTATGIISKSFGNANDRQEQGVNAATVRDYTDPARGFIDSGFTVSGAGDGMTINSRHDIDFDDSWFNSHRNCTAGHALNQACTLCGERVVAFYPFKNCTAAICGDARCRTCNP